MTHNNDNNTGDALNMTQPKFSMVEDERNQTYVRLVKFVYWLAGNNTNPDNVLMDFDEIVGELLLELAKGLKVYGDLPDEELDAVIRRMMDNRISELRYKYYCTHRKIGLSLTVSTDDGDEWIECADDGIDTDEIAASRHRVQFTREKLSPIAKRVFDALIYGSERLSKQLKLSNVRANSVYKNHKVRVRPHHVADALLISEDQVVESYNEIRESYQEACRGS